MSDRTSAFDPRGLLAAGSRVVVVVSTGPRDRMPPLVEVPELIGAKQGDALGLLQDGGLEPRVFNDYSDVHKRGEVMGQLPPAGVGVPRDSSVVVLVSSGPAVTKAALEPLPDVVGKSEPQAVAALTAAGFSPQVVHESSQSVPAGSVIAQLPNRLTLASMPAKKSRWLPWLIAAAVVVLLAIAAWMYVRSTAPVSVPDVFGMTQAEAVAAIEAAGLKPAVEQGEAQGDPGTVATQTPEPLTEVAKGATVRIGIIGEVELAEVPDVTSMNQADATKKLQKAGFTVVVTREDSIVVDKGRVISQTPSAGKRAVAGSEVAVVVSSGQTQSNVKVPDVVGMTRDKAVAELQKLGLVVIWAENASYEQPTGNIVSQLPKAGDSVAPGTTVGIVVSTGDPVTADDIAVPDVTGLTLTEAQQVLSDAGLQSMAVAASGSSEPQNEVVAQTPGAGDKVQEGTTIVLFYSTGS